MCVYIIYDYFPLYIYNFLSVSYKQLACIYSVINYMFLYKIKRLARIFKYLSVLLYELFWPHLYRISHHCRMSIPNSGFLSQFETNFSLTDLIYMESTLR